MEGTCIIAPKCFIINIKKGRMNLGYACINMSLSGLPKSKRITTNRSMIKRTFKQKGIAYASELGLLNCKDLYKVLEWNLANGFSFFRCLRTFFRGHRYRLEEMPDYQEIKQCSRSVATLPSNGMRITTHPGPFQCSWITEPRRCDQDHQGTKHTFRSV